MKPTVSPKNMHVIIGSSSSRDPKFGMFFSCLPSYGCLLLKLLDVPHMQGDIAVGQALSFTFQLSSTKATRDTEDVQSYFIQPGDLEVGRSTWGLWKKSSKITYAKSPNLPSLPKSTVVLIHKPDLSLHSCEGEPAFPWRGWQSPQEPSLYLPSYYLTVTTTCSSSPSRIQCCWKRAVTQIYTPEM